MSMTDPIGDMLTRIRNANMVKHESVEMPSSKMKIEIAKILKKEGYIRDFRYYKFQNKFNLKVFLKYGERILTSLRESPAFPNLAEDFILAREPSRRFSAAWAFLFSPLPRAS